jgi:hypothetical protein
MFIERHKPIKPPNSGGAAWNHLQSEHEGTTSDVRLYAAPLGLVSLREGFSIIMSRRWRLRELGYNREQEDLDQAEISGLSEKQVGRIARGECRLTSNALESLAKAHQLEPNEYMRKLASAMDDPL